MGFVLDCSATMPWILANDSSGYAERVLNALAESTAYVPTIWPLEVVNVLLVFERKKRLKPNHTLLFMRSLRELPITLITTSSAQVFNRVHELGTEYALSAYDASYLEVSLRNGIPLATLDKNLRDAAVASGVGVFEST